MSGETVGNDTLNMVWCFAGFGPLPIRRREFAGGALSAHLSPGHNFLRYHDVSGAAAIPSNGSAPEATETASTEAAKTASKSAASKAAEATAAEVVREASITVAPATAAPSATATEVTRTVTEAATIAPTVGTAAPQALERLLTIER